MTGEHLSPARRVFRPLRVERTLDAKVSDRRIILELRDGIVLERLAIVVADDVEAGAIVGGDERRTHEARASADGDGDLERSVRFRRHPHREADAPVGPDVRALAVDDERELLAGNEAADAEVLNRELVLAVS